MKKTILALLFATVGVNAFAADPVIQLKDGRSVVLHNDFTWEYVQPKEQVNVQSSKYAERNKVEPLDAIPVVSNQQNRMAQIQIGNDKNVLQVSQSGVDLLFKAARYDQGELIIPVSVTNNGKASLIKVDVEYHLFDSQGDKILKGEASVWTSVKRLPETYLRSGKQAKGIDLRIPVGMLSSYDFKAQISDISTRN